MITLYGVSIVEFRVWDEHFGEFACVENEEG